jgi:hypothetical protein
VEPVGTAASIVLAGGSRLRSRAGWAIICRQAMTDRRPPTVSEGHQPPELTRLERGGDRHVTGWRLAAVAVGVLLVGVIVAGRLGMDDRPPAALPTGSPPAMAQPSEAPAEPAPSPVDPSPRAVPADGQHPEPVSDVPRHLDGIPTSIGGEKVFRLASALERAGSRPVLVGGWYLGPDCTRVGRCVGRLADSPAAAMRSATSTGLIGLVEPGTGPRVVRARVEQECWRVLQPPSCVDVLSVIEVVWRGDFHTETGPIGAQPLISALSYAFPELRPEPFRDFARCAVAWPPQTYRSLRGGPRMALVFPSIEDRLWAEANIVAGWPRPVNNGAGQCVDHFMALPEPASWVSAANVMIWAAEDDTTRALVDAALRDALANSVPRDDITTAPFTPWTALLALRAWDASLGFGQQHDRQVWGADGAAAAFALNDPLVRVLLLFPSPAERRAFQAEVDAGDVIVLVNVGVTQESVGLGLLDVRSANPRWLGYRNVLLQVTGPDSFDEGMRAALSAVHD